MTLAAIVVVYTLFIVFEVIALKNANQKKQLVVYCILMGIAFTLSVLIVFDVDIPSIDRLVGDLIMPPTGE